MTANTMNKPARIRRATLSTLLSAFALGMPVFGVAATITVSPTTVWAQDEDEDSVEDVVVYLDKGEQKSLEGGVVESADYTTVVYKKGSRKQNVSAGSVVHIRWGDAITDYAQAQRWLAQGNAEGSKKAFELCVTGNVAGEIRDWILEYGNVGAGEAYMAMAAKNSTQRASLLKKAQKAFADAKGANGKSLILDRILMGAASAAQGAGDTSGAITAAQDLARAGTSSGRRDWELAGKMLVADIHRSAGNHGQAASAYDAVQRYVDSAIATARDEETKAALEGGRRRAAAQQGWVLLEKALGSKAQSDFDAARRYFDGLKGKYGREPEVLAAASNAEGVMAFETEKYVEAVRAFESTEVLYYSVGDEVARSLYYQTLCFEKTGDTKRAEAAAQDLRKYFPRSEWVQKLK